MVWAPKKICPKKVLITLFLYLFHVKTERNIRKHFQYTQTSFPEYTEHEIFLDPQLQPLGGLGYH